MANAAYPLLLLTTLFWGGNAVAGKLAVGHISPFALTSLRWILAVLILLPFAWPRVKQDLPVIRKHAVTLFLLGTVGFTFFNASLYMALIHTAAINAAIEQAAIPMLVIVLNFLIFRTRVTWLQIAGFLLSLLGVSLTASHGNLARLAQLDVNIGDFIMLIGVLVYALYTVFLRYKPAIHWQSTITVLAGAAFVSSLPFLAWEIASERFIAPDAKGWTIGVYTVLFPSIISQIFYIRGNELIGPNRAGLFINLVPIFGTLLSVVILGENFQLYHAAALVLVFLGIGLAEYSGRKASQRTPSVRASLDGK